MIRRRIDVVSGTSEHIVLCGKSADARVLLGDVHALRATLQLQASLVISSYNRLSGQAASVRDHRQVWLRVHVVTGSTV